MTMSFKKNQLVWLEADLSLGPALIVDDEELYLIRFLVDGEERNYTKKNPPMKRIQFHVGQKLTFKGEASAPIHSTLLNVELKNDFYTLHAEAGVFTEDQVTHVESTVGIVDLLRQAKFSPAKTFHLRHQAWQLLNIRKNHFLQGAVGCRVQLLPHQMMILNESLKMNESCSSVRALLADEVGLGKTIEAGLLFSALHARQKMKKVLILVPAALKVQWLTESFRRFNIRFRLDHEELIEESEFRDFVVASLDEIENNMSDLDMLIVDESHRLVHDSHKATLLEELVGRSRHVLFLSATPRLHGDDEFVKMISILGTKLESQEKVLVFQSKRSELGLRCFRQLEAAMVEDKKVWLYSFLENILEERRRSDNKERKKVFIIGSKAEDVIRLSHELRAKFGENFALFHEDMDLVERDRQAAYFAEPEGAQFLVSSEVGGEGRNFQFCHDMVLLDLPADPLVVEQRIGRLDRLGQTQTVHIWCPVLENSSEEKVFENLRDKYQVFSEPWSGSGLEDLESEDLLQTREVSSNLKSLESRAPFRKVDYDDVQATRLLEEANELSEEPIREFLDQLYNLFGVEVEDFDARGNWRVFTSSLMFVDYFPGLGEEGERVLSFDREQALSREDMTLYTLDHPDFVESIEFLLNSEQGKLSISSLPEDAERDVLFLGATPEGELLARSGTQNRDLIVRPNYLDPQKSLHDKNLPMGLIAALPAVLEEWGIEEKLDALLLMIPES